MPSSTWFRFQVTVHGSPLLPQLLTWFCALHSPFTTLSLVLHTLHCTPTSPTHATLPLCDTCYHGHNTSSLPPCTLLLLPPPTSHHLHLGTYIIPPLTSPLFLDGSVLYGGRDPRVLHYSYHSKRLWRTSFQWAPLTPGVSLYLPFHHWHAYSSCCMVHHALRCLCCAYSPRGSSSLQSSQPALAHTTTPPPPAFLH